MLLTTPKDLIKYLKAHPFCHGTDIHEIRPLSGGVSNLVWRVTTSNGDWVVKQALPKLQVKDDWFAPQERLIREWQCMQLLDGYISPNRIPDVLFHDADLFLYAMTAAPEGARPWKTHLMEGRIDISLAAECGRMLAAMHNATAGQGAAPSQPGPLAAQAQALFGSIDGFEQLRLSPYHKTTAQRNPDVARPLQEVINLLRSWKLTLVHGDFSPKNMLVDGLSFILLDFEVAHYGDPTFDVAFCLNHLMLKAFFRPDDAKGYLEAGRAYIRRYLDDVLPPVGAHVADNLFKHLGALMLARIDGKSPAEYLVGHPQQESVRLCAKHLLVSDSLSWDEALGLVGRAVGSG